MSKKTGFDQSALIFIAVVCLLAFFTIGFKKLHSHFNQCPDVKIVLSDAKIKAGLPVTASFQNEKVKSWDWNFGDSTTHGNTATVVHAYKIPGKYTLALTVNGKCTQSEIVTVLPGNRSLPKPVIDGPSTVVVGQPAKFKEVSGLGTSWEWSFRETGGIDSKDWNPTYTFTTVGKKTIMVTMNGPGKSDIGYFDVNVTAASTSEAPKVQQITESQFIIMLYQIIDKKKDVSIFKEALCDNVKIIAVVNNEKKPFDDFCKQIRGLHHRTIIDNLKLTRNFKHCVTGITIQTHQGNWRL